MSCIEKPCPEKPCPGTETLCTAIPCTETPRDPGPGSHFQLVGEFHDTFGHPQKTEPYVECFTREPKLIPFRISLMREELAEFTYALKINDMIEMADALCDLIYVTYGAGHCLGLDLDQRLNAMNHDTMTFRDRTPGSPGHQEPGPVNLSFIHDNRAMIDDELKIIENYITEFCSAAANTNTNNASAGPGIQDPNTRVTCVRVIAPDAPVPRNPDPFDPLIALDRISVCLACIVLTVYRLGHNLRFNMDGMFREVHRSNMTKVCHSVEDANQSLEFYNQEARYGSPAIRSKGKYFVVYDAATTKILKNHKWETPNITQFF
jgi:predicted HAD superfamily Cof-like phosphohydrolase